MEIPQNILKELEERKIKALLGQSDSDKRQATSDKEEKPSLAVVPRPDSGQTNTALPVSSAVEAPVRHDYPAPAPSRIEWPEKLEERGKMGEKGQMGQMGERGEERGGIKETEETGKPLDYARGEPTGGEMFFGFVSKLAVFLAIFLTPLFFFASSDTINLPKQFLLSVLALIGLMAGVGQTIASGRVVWRKNFILLPMLLVALAAVFSSFFSSSFWVSFLGDSGRYASSGLSILSYLILSVVAFQVLERGEKGQKGKMGEKGQMGETSTPWSGQAGKKGRDVNIAVGLWLVSSALVSVFALFQFFGIFIFENYASSVFNTIGDIFELPLFILMTVPLVVALARGIKNIRFRTLLYALAALHLIVAAMVDFRVGWLGLAGAALVLILAGLKKGDEMGQMGQIGERGQIGEKGQTHSAGSTSSLQTSSGQAPTSLRGSEQVGQGGLMLPLGLLMAAVLLWFVNVPAPQSLNIPQEVSPSYRASLNVAGQTLKNHFVFGSGWETFPYEYAKFKSAVLNQTNFWGVNFNNSSSEFIDWTVTGGLFGIISLLIYSGWFLVYAWRKMGTRGEMGQRGLEEGLFASWIFILVTKFFYGTPLVVELFFWLLPVLFLLVVREEKGERGEMGQDWSYRFQAGSAKTLAMFFALLIILLSGLVGAYFSIRRWQAETIFVKAVTGDNSPEKRDEVTNGIYAAIITDPYETRYFRILSQVLFAKLNDVFGEVQKRETSAQQLKPEEGVLVQNLTVRNINAVQRAVALDPANVAVYVDAAEAFRNLAPLIQGADDLAIQNYERAAELEPINPFIKTQLGQLYLVKSNLFNYGLKIDTDMVDKARAVLEKALELNPNYANARYFLALIYDQDGKKDIALQNFLFLRQTNPDNKLIAAIVANLQNGYPALGNPPQPATPPQSPKAKETKGVPK